MNNSRFTNVSPWALELIEDYNRNRESSWSLYNSARTTSSPSSRLWGKIGTQNPYPYPTPRQPAQRRVPFIDQVRSRAKSPDVIARAGRVQNLRLGAHEFRYTDNDAEMGNPDFMKQYFAAPMSREDLLKVLPELTETHIARILKLESWRLVSRYSVYFGFVHRFQCLYCPSLLLYVRYPKDDQYNPERERVLSCDICFSVR